MYLECNRVTIEFHVLCQQRDILVLFVTTDNVISNL